MIFLQDALSAATSHVGDHAKVIAETVKAWAEAFAFVSAGGFFLYKAFSGYMISNLALNVVCQRKKMPTGDCDYLLVNAVVKKGDRQALTLHDAQARISAPAANQPALKKFSGVTRLGFVRTGNAIQIKESQSHKNPFLNLPPGDETVFSTFFEVRGDEPCIVEVTLLGGWRWDFGTVYQWRASQVSLPL